MNKYKSARPIHPGEILKEEIEYRGLSQGKLAAQMGMSYKMMNHILNEHRPLTTQTALLFEAALGIDSDLLMRMQLKYNSRIALQDKSFSNRLAEIRNVAAVL
jgi:addiction module antidote protein, HigA family